MRSDASRHQGVQLRTPTLRNLFWISPKTDYICIYCTWFEAKRNSVWYQFHRKMVYTIWLLNKIQKTLFNRKSVITIQIWLRLPWFRKWKYAQKDNYFCGVEISMHIGKFRLKLESAWLETGKFRQPIGQVS